MAQARNESQLTAQIVREIKKKYPSAWVLKTHGNGYQRIGVPDLLIVESSNLFALEVKHQKPGESDEHMLSRVSPHQEKELNDLRSAGATAEVVWSVDQALRIISSRREQ